VKEMISTPCASREPGAPSSTTAIATARGFLIMKRLLLCWRPVGGLERRGRRRIGGYATESLGPVALRRRRTTRASFAWLNASDRFLRSRWKRRISTSEREVRMVGAGVSSAPTWN